MSVSNAYVRVNCDAPRCREEIEIDLPFTYGGVMHTEGHYDHTHSAIGKRLRKQEWIVNTRGHFCCGECARWPEARR